MTYVAKGWLIKKREHGKIIFLDMRTIDQPWIPLQVVIKKQEVDEITWENAKKLRQEASFIAEGELIQNPRAPGGRELRGKQIIIVHNPEEPWPLGKKSHPPEVLMKYRHLSVRGQKFIKIWIVREKLIHYLREWFEKNHWHEVSPPIFVMTACEGGATLFRVKWFEEKIPVYLTQSAQLYLEALCFALGRVWCLAPSFRAEKSRTRRHLAEYWHLEAEAAFFNFEDNLRVQEELVIYAIKKLLNDDVTGELIKEIRGNVDDLDEIKAPLPRVTYTEAMEILQRKNFKIKWGDDLGADEEKALSEEIGTAFFLTHFPTEIKSFYVKLDPNDPRVCLAADLIVPHVGEIIGGSERETDVNELIKRIKAQGFDPTNYEWYLDLRRFGSVPHSGFGLGIDRFLMYILKLEHIRDTLPFPRLARVKYFI